MPRKRKAQGAPGSSNSPASTTVDHFICPNPLCRRPFTTLYGLSNHYIKQATCQEASDGIRVPGATAKAEVADANSTQGYLDDEYDFNADYPYHNPDDDVASVEVIDVIGRLANTGLHPGNPSALGYGIAYTNTQFVETKLLKILNDANTPLYLYGEIQSWAQEAKTLQYDFVPSTVCRDRLVNNLEQWQHLEHRRPRQVPIKFPEDNLEIEVTCWDFVAQLQSLLTDKVLTGNISNLDVNPTNPFTKYASPDGRLHSFNSGEWYANAWEHCCKPDSNDWLCPIIFACDKTLVGSHMGRASVTPLVFTLSIFSEALRNKPIAWRTLGYLYDITQHGKGVRTVGVRKARKINPAEKSQRFHRVLRTILSPFFAIQHSGGIKEVSVELGTFRKVVTIQVPTAVILGDMQGGDEHCGSSISYSVALKCLSRACNVSGAESGNPLVRCKRLSMVKIRDMVLKQELEKLKELNQNNVYPAWFDSCFGGCPRGVFTAAMPVEALHAVEAGLIKDALTIFFTIDLTDAKCRHFDRLVIKMCSWDRQRLLSSGATKALPRMLFKDGVSTLSRISATDIVGIMLTVSAMALTESGNEYLASILGTRRLADAQYVFDLLLCYWSWLRKPTYWKCGDKNAPKEAEWSIRRLLSLLADLWPREAGQGWYKAKFHEQLHVIADILRHGSPRNTYTGPTEHNHIAEVKDLSKVTQKRRVFLDKQLGTRLHHVNVVDHCYDRMTADYSYLYGQEATTPVVPPGSIRNASTLATLTLVRGPQEPMLNHTIVWPGLQRRAGTKQITLDYDPCVLACLKDHWAPAFYDPIRPTNICTLSCFTDYKRGGSIFRAHPKRGNQKWYDWVIIRWEKSEADLLSNKTYRTNANDRVYSGDPESMMEYNHYAPGQLMCFFIHPETGENMAVVKCCNYIHQGSGTFSTKWTIEFVDPDTETIPFLAIIKLDAVVRHCCMIQHNEEHKVYHEIWERERWADEFCGV